MYSIKITSSEVNDGVQFKDGGHNSSRCEDGRSRNNFVISLRRSKAADPRSGRHR